MPDDKFGFAVRLVGPLIAFKCEPLFCDQMERAFGSTFARSEFGPAMLDRIGTFADKAASDRGRPARFDERNLRVGAKAEKVFLSSARPAVAEQPYLTSVWSDA